MALNNQSGNLDIQTFKELSAGAGSDIFKVNSEGIFAGAVRFADAPFQLTYAGKIRATDFELIGGSISDTILSGLAQGSDINILGWTSDLNFQATDYRTVTWQEGTIKLADGTTFNILTGNTGNMAALTYIYFDKAVSTTALQVTTTPANAVGANKILIAVAQNNSDTASKAPYQVFGGKGGQLITVDNIAANAASVNEFISNTAQIKDAVITSAKIASLNADKINVGILTGFIVQTKATGYRVKINGDTNKIEYLNGDTVLSSSYVSADGDHITNATDDVLFAIGGTIKCGVHSGAFKPNSDKAYDLGADEAQWNNVYGNVFYGGSSGTAGATFVPGTLSGTTNSGSIGFITSVKIERNGDKVEIYAKFRELKVQGGIFTGVSSESSWMWMEDASVID